MSVAKRIKQLGQDTKLRRKQAALKKAKEEAALNAPFMVAAGNVSTKGDQASMQDPFYTLSKSNHSKDPVYYCARGDDQITVYPSAKGMPTIWDKDIILFITGHILAAKNKDELYSSTIKTTPYEILKVCRRGTSGKSYAALDDALDRLSGAFVKTNIMAGGEYFAERFQLITTSERGKLKKGKKDRRLATLKITLCDWLYNSILVNDVLTYSPEYFNLKSPIDRRLYEIARKHCGKNKPSWPISMHKLLRRTGLKNSNLVQDDDDLKDSRQVKALKASKEVGPENLAKFREALKALRSKIKTGKVGSIPDYRIEYHQDKDMVIFHNNSYQPKSARYRGIRHDSHSFQSTKEKHTDIL
ncbi:MAG: replication initiator protein A, partial [Candidatus Thiodiazotropha sp.]|nr:replication initiator protein A [Candidatus Thiodiazotropha sp.]